MKKWVAFMLALLLAVHVGVVRAEAAKDTKTEKYTITDAAAVAPEMEKRPITSDREPASAYVTTDTVTIDAGTVTVVTGSGTQLYLTVPSGACCITQDVHQQLDIYLGLYSDIGAALKTYSSSGIHMDIFDYCTGVSTYVSESDNTLAALTGDMNLLKDASVRQIGDYLSKNWYGGCPAVVKTIGGSKYISFDLSKDYGFVVYNHFANGKLIQVYTFCDSGVKGSKRVETILAKLSFSTGEPAAETEETLPEAEETVPVTEETVPVAEETTPETEETVPETEETLPETAETTSETEAAN